MLRCIVLVEQSNKLAIRDNVILLPMSFISTMHWYISSSTIRLPRPINLPTILSFSDNVNDQALGLNITLAKPPKLNHEYLARLTSCYLSPFPDLWSGFT